MMTLKRHITMYLPVLATIAVMGCGTSTPTSPGVERSYVATKVNGVDLPAVIAEIGGNSTTLKAQNLVLANDGTYRLTYTLILRAGASNTEEQRIENGNYRISGTTVTFEHSVTHSALTATGTGLAVLRGEMNIAPSASAAMQIEYVLTP